MEAVEGVGLESGVGGRSDVCMRGRSAVESSKLSCM